MKIEHELFRDHTMKILIENHCHDLILLTENEFEKTNESFDEFDGISPYIILGYVHDKKPICNVCNDYLDDDSPHQFCPNCGKSKLIENGFCNCCGAKQ